MVTVKPDEVLCCMSLFSTSTTLTVHSTDGPSYNPNGRVLQWNQHECLKTDVFGTWSILLSSSDAAIDAAIQFYQDDLVSPDVVHVELVRWRRKWSEGADKSNLPNSASPTLRECDPIFFPNINALLRILCTLPVTSAQCERSFSTLKHLRAGLFKAGLR